MCHLGMIVSRCPNDPNLPSHQPRNPMAMKDMLYAFVGLFVFVGITLSTRLYKALPQNRPRNNGRSGTVPSSSHVAANSTSKSSALAPANANNDDDGGGSEQGGLRSRSGRGRMPESISPCTMTIFLGSGGHTAEMLQLISGLDVTKYFPRHYVVGWDDEASVEKVHRLEASRQQRDVTAFFRSTGNGASSNQVVEQLLDGYTIHRIPRSRHVHQSMITTPFTLAKSLWVAMPLIKRLSCLVSQQDIGEEARGRAVEQTLKTRRKSVLLMNGPGTCFALALSVIGSRTLGVPDELTPDLVFVESFARVKTLSLAGKLLYPLCDIFLVQWPGLAERYPRARYIGMLV